MAPDVFIMTCYSRSPIPHAPYAHRLPSEVITFVVQHLPYDKHGAIQKRGLAAASLTCRFWAKLLQPSLFQELTLRSPEDVTQLLAFINAPCPIFDKLSTHIRDITYHKRDIRIPPWLRLHTLSRLVRQARFFFMASQSADDSGHRAIDGSSFIHCLPRTLPPAAFPPILRLELHDVEFATFTLFVRLTHTFPALERCEGASLTFNKMSGIEEQPRAAARIQSRTSKGNRSLGVDMLPRRPIADFTTQLRLASVILDIRRTLLVAEEECRIFEMALAALVPSTIGVRGVRLDLGGIQFCSISAVGTGEAAHIWFEVQITKQCSACTCDSRISQLRVDTSKAREIPLTNESWREFEEILARLQHLPVLEVVVGTDEPTLESVLQDRILSKAAAQKKLRLCFARPENKLDSATSTKEDLLQVAEEHDVDGDILKLTPTERLQLLDSRDKREYLHGLKMLRQRRSSELEINN